MNHLGKRLRALRERARLRREELAARAGVSYGTVVAVESRGSEPKWETVRRLARTLADALDVSEVEVLAELIQEEVTHA